MHRLKTVSSRSIHVLHGIHPRLMRQRKSEGNWNVDGDQLISTISKDLDHMKATITNDFSETSQTDCHSQLSNFQLVSCEELASLIKGSSLKSCQLDPVPALVLRQCYDILLPVSLRSKRSRTKRTKFGQRALVLERLLRRLSSSHNKES